MMFDAFRINYFGDFIDCKVGLNAQSLIEIIDGRIQNKLAVEGITQIVRESDNCCQVRIQYGRNDFAIYILRPEDYDSFISNLLFLLEDIATNRLEHQDSMTIMEERVAVYALVDYKPVNQSVPINGLIQSATIDDYFLANIDVKADVEVEPCHLLEVPSSTYRADIELYDEK
jgi:hypothetical protein